MPPLQPWYCQYEINEAGRVKVKLVLSETPTEAHSRDLVFASIEDMPPALRDAVDAHRKGTGADAGTFDFPEGYRTEVETLVFRRTGAAPPKRREEGSRSG